MKSIDINWKPDGVVLSKKQIWTIVYLLTYVHDWDARKWTKRVFIDLYSGTGCAIVRNSGKWFKGSPLLALSVKDPFDKHIFCEKDESSIMALEKRIENNFSRSNIN